MNYLLAFIAFNVIVIVHELGHFIAAKKFGIKVLEFSLFIGPKLYSIQKGETTYSIRLLPIMAYVKMEGEEEASDSERAFNNKPRYARALTAFSGPFANLVLAAILLTIVFATQGYTTTEIAKVGVGSSVAVAGLKPGDVITKYENKRVYLPLDVMQFLYISKGKKADVEYVRNGIKDTVTIKPTIIPASMSYKLGASFSSETESDTNVIKTLTPGYPAEKAGLIKGDRIVGINGTKVSNIDEIRAFLEKNGEKEVTVTALRKNSEVTVNLVPKAEKVTEQYDIGIEFVGKNGNILDSLKEAFIFSYSIIRSVVYSLVWLVTGQVPFNQMMGPIGMVSSIGEAVQQGPDLMAKVVYLLQITGLLSIAIGATNLIPFPMLDGNRLLLIGIEAIRRKPLKPEREAFISMVGFVLLILLAIFAAFNDIMRLVNG
jgi:RIP metalloprotease RseP